MAKLSIVIIITAILGLPTTKLEAATYNFNFYNKEQVANPPSSSASVPAPSLGPTLPPAPIVVIQEKAQKVSRFRITLSGITDTFKKTEDRDKRDELAYSRKSEGYRLGLSFGEQGSFIVTPYIQYTTFNFESPTQLLEHCGSFYNGSDSDGNPQYIQRCYNEAYRTDHQAKIPAGGLALDKEWMLGEVLVAGLGVGGSYGVEDRKDPRNDEKSKVKQKSYYGSVKFGMLLRPEIMFNARGEFGKTLTDADVVSEGNQIQFEVDNNYLRGALELSYLF